jgi:hypothetical protein
MPSRSLDSFPITSRLHPINTCHTPTLSGARTSPPGRVFALGVVFNVRIVNSQEVSDRCIDPDQDDNWSVLYLEPGERLPDLTPYKGREILLVIRPHRTPFASPWGPSCA